MRKRSKYRRKGVLLNPLNYVLEGFAPMASHGSQLLTLKLKNHEAMVALFEGRAGSAQVGALIAMYNITEALLKMGFGTGYEQHVSAAQDALINIVKRHYRIHKFEPTQEEVEVLNLLMELHEAQMEVITIKEMDAAIKSAHRELQSGRAINLRNLRNLDGDQIDGQPPKHEDRAVHHHH